MLPREIEIPSEMISMVNTLATAPESQRRNMLQTQLRRFADMPEEKRVSEMAVLIRAVYTLDDPSQKALVKSRVACLCDDFDEPDRKKLVATHIKALQEVPRDVREAEIKTLFAAIPELEAEHRRVTLVTMKSVLLEAPENQRREIINLIPEETREILGV
jgi:hypothetical protein